MQTEAVITEDSEDPVEGDREKLVSVIIPTYNAENWVSETIDSVVAQTYADVELIVVDDGSQDDTASVVRRKLSEDFTKSWRFLGLDTNRGACVARNAGLQAARGSWVQFLDSDDFLAPMKLERQMAYCIRAPSDVAAVCSPWRRCSSEGGKIVWEGAMIEPNVAGLTPVMCLTGRASVLHPSGLARRTLLNQVGGFDETLRFWEFEELNVRIAKAGRIELVRSTEPYYNWRLHRSEMYIGGDEARYQATDVALGWIEQVLKAVDHRPLDKLALSAADSEALLGDCTKWARLLYSHDRLAFRKYVALARQLVPNIAPTNPRYVSMASRYIGYENAEAIAKLGRTPRTLVRKALQRLELRRKNGVFDWN